MKEVGGESGEGRRIGKKGDRKRKDIIKEESDFPCTGPQDSDDSTWNQGDSPCPGPT